MSDIPTILGNILDRQTAADLDGQARELRNQAGHESNDRARRQLVDRAEAKETRAAQLRRGGR